MAIITTVKERINQLNQAGFQILCDAFLAREGYPGIEEEISDILKG